jgi:uncharacterized protein YjdB
MVILPAEMVLLRGETVQLHVRIVGGAPPFEPPPAVRWTSSDPGVVHVSQNGTAKGLQKGEATIRADGGGFVAETTVSVGLSSVGTDAH